MIRYRRVRPNETPYGWLRVTFMKDGHEVRTVYQSEPTAVRNMSRWNSQGPEYRCRNEPVRLGSLRNLFKNEEDDERRAYSPLSQSQWRRWLRQERPTAEEYAAGKIHHDGKNCHAGRETNR